MADIIREDVDLSLVENEITSEVLEEGAAPVKNFFIKGPFIQAEVVNGNKRSYPRAIIEREVDAHIKTKIAESRALGELGHPPTSELNLDRVSHLIKELKMNGNTAFGKAQVLDTPCGRIVKSLMESGVKLGVSTRGVGSLKNGVVQSDYKLLCVDVVADPSGPDCFVSAVCEGKEWVYENGILVEKEIKQEVEQIIIENKFSVADKQAAFLKLFQDSINKIAQNL